MQRLIIINNDRTANIEVSRVEREESVIFAYKENAIVGVFDLGTIDWLYISGKATE